MILWLVLTIMVSIAAVFVSAPFIRHYDRTRSKVGADIAVYRDQLTEIDHESSLGVIDATQAEAARIEIKRRMLAVADSQEPALPVLSSGERTFAAIAVAGIVVFGSVGLFALTADLEPISPRLSARFELPTNRAPDTSANKQTEVFAPKATSSSAPTTPTRTAQTSLPPVEELIQRILNRLQRNPKDVDGWRMLGWSYYSTDHFSEAAEAYAKAIELKPDSADFRDGRTEALVRAANGVVTPEAKTAIEETLKISPKDPRARYLKGLAIEQAGDKAGAQKEWNDLINELAPDDPWSKELKRKISDGENSVQIGQSPAGADPKNIAAVPTPSMSVATSKADNTTADKGPSAEDIRSAEAMSPNDRTAMIHRMVDSLADRLDRSPHDADGWIKLIRALSVLGESDRAKLSFEKALKTFENEPGESKRIAATAEQLGLTR